MFEKLESFLSGKNIYVVSLVGIILGIIIYNFLGVASKSLTLEINPLYLHMVLGFPVAYIYAKYVDKKTQKNQELTPNELRVVLLTIGAFPVIAWLVYYYTWKKLWPLKAAKANKIGWIIFITGLLLGVVQFFLVYFSK